MSKIDRSVVIAHYPLRYSEKDIKWLEECIKKGIEETGVVVVPEDISVMVLPIN